jgi:endonuclease III
MAGRVLSGGELVARLGPHPARAWGLDLATDAGLARWLIAACLLAPRGDEKAAGSARAALAAHGLDEPDALASAGPAPVAKLLGDAGYPKPEITAARLLRASRALRDRHSGSLTALISTADGLADAGAALVALAPGLGPATAAEILRPLRDRFSAVREIPLAPAARAAGVHLGFLQPGADEEGEPTALRAALARESPAPELADVEAALTRLGRAACRRGTLRSCPLGADCPALQRDRSGGDAASQS